MQAHLNSVLAVDYRTIIVRLPVDVTEENQNRSHPNLATDLAPSGVWTWFDPIRCRATPPENYQDDT